MQSLACSSSLCVLGPSGTARLPGNVECFQGEKLLITIWMERGLEIGFTSAPELTVPQVGSSSEVVSQQPFAILRDGCVRKGGPKSQRTKCGEEVGAAVLGGSARTGPRCRPAWRLSCCRSLAGLRSTFFSTAGLQTVVLGTKFISLGFAPFCRVWPVQTVNFKRDMAFTLVFFFFFASNS